MKLEDLRGIPCYQTASIAEAIKSDKNTLAYILACLERFYAGDYGLIPEEDIEANNSDLANGCGHVLARYEAREALEHEIYIESHFDALEAGNVDFNNTMICYTFER